MENLFKIKIRPTMPKRELLERVLLFISIGPEVFSALSLAATSCLK